MSSYCDLTFWCICAQALNQQRVEYSETQLEVLQGKAVCKTFGYLRRQYDKTVGYCNFAQQ